MGDIHVWDRESGSLLHHVRGATVGGDLTAIAWNHATGPDDPFEFATGSHDGALRIWTTPPSEIPVEPQRSESPMMDLPETTESPGPMHPTFNENGFRSAVAFALAQPTPGISEPTSPVLQ